MKIIVIFCLGFVGAQLNAATESPPPWGGSEALSVALDAIYRDQIKPPGSEGLLPYDAAIVRSMLMVREAHLNARQRADRSYSSELWTSTIGLAVFSISDSMGGWRGIERHAFGTGNVYFFDRDLSVRILKVQQERTKAKGRDYISLLLALLEDTQFVPVFISSDETNELLDSIQRSCLRQAAVYENLGIDLAAIERRIQRLKKENEPNKAVEPTPVSVTISAAQKVAPLTSVAHL
jgi:hypothetical protein